MIAYLDLFRLYRATARDSRNDIRRSLRRDEAMSRCLRIQLNRCFYCGVSIGLEGHLDHLIPVYYGGTNRSRNLVASCRECNLLKGTQQLVITNEQTIAFYERLKKEFRLWIVGKRRGENPRKNRYVRLYYLYRADLFTGRQP